MPLEIYLKCALDLEAGTTIPAAVIFSCWLIDIVLNLIYIYIYIAILVLYIDKKSLGLAIGVQPRLGFLLEGTCAQTDV